MFTSTPSQITQVSLQCRKVSAIFAARLGSAVISSLPFSAVRRVMCCNATESLFGRASSICV